MFSKNIQTKEIDYVIYPLCVEDIYMEFDLHHLQNQKYIALIDI